MPGHCLQQGVLTPGPHWEQHCGPWLLPPSTSAELFSAAGHGSCNPDPSGRGAEEPSLWGEWGFRLPSSPRSPGQLRAPPAVAAWCMARASLPSVAPTLPILSWQQHGGTGNSSLLCKPFPGPVCCVPLGDHTRTPRLGFPQALCTHPSLGSSAAPDSLPGRGIPCGSRG